VLPQTSLPGLKRPISKGREGGRTGGKGKGGEKGGRGLSSKARGGKRREGYPPKPKNQTSHTATDPSATQTRSAQIAHLCSAAVSLNAHVHQLLPVLQNERTNAHSPLITLAP